jgi:hypothetical protein
MLRARLAVAHTFEEVPIDQPRDACTGEKNGRGDPELYDREVLPRIRGDDGAPTDELTGLSQFHFWKVLQGHGRLHARRWAAIST